MMNVVIYARYSSDKQREESIEAQLKVCHAYAEREGYNVISEYIDRALSGRTDDRPQFQIMIKDSRKKHFEKVIVYRLDRFSRSTLDSAIYKDILLKNGVKLESATESIPDNSSGILLEAVIGGVNAWYSAELSEKVTRNMNLNAEKCLSNGGATPLGYRIENKKYVLDNEKAPIVKEIFTKYANGMRVKDICDGLNERHLTTSQGVKFNKNSMHTLLKNRKYLGIYIYNGTEIPGGMPQIIDEDLFNKVADRMKINKKAPARARAKAEYLLTTKLFCGYCKEMMIGHSSNKISKSGIIYNYYKCKNTEKLKTCKKKMVMKDFIEKRVIEECLKILTQQNIRNIAKEVVKVAQSYDDKAELKRLENLLKKTQEEKENQMASLRSCKLDDVREMIFADLSKISAEIKELEKQCEIEKARHYIIPE